MEASLVAPRPSAAGPGGVGRGTCVPFRVWLWVQMYRFAAVPTGPWLSAVYHVRAGKRYYGLMRRSDELRPAWASSAYSGRSLPWRAVRLTFPALAVVYDRACPSRGLPQPESAITTRPNHPLPRQDLHLQVCPSLKVAHRKLVFAHPLVLSAARVTLRLWRSPPLCGSPPPHPSRKRPWCSGPSQPQSCNIWRSELSAKRKSLLDSLPVV